MTIIDRRGATVDGADAPAATTPNAGLAIKTAARVATTGSNIALSGLQTIDGVALATGDRVLVKDQTDTTTNGIYSANAAAWTLTSDFKDNSQVASGVQVNVTAGILNASSSWSLSATDPVVLGTSAIAFIATGRLQSLILGGTPATPLTLHFSTQTQTIFGGYYSGNIGATLTNGSAVWNFYETSIDAGSGTAEPALLLTSPAANYPQLFLTQGGPLIVGDFASPAPVSFWNLSGAISDGTGPGIRVGGDIICGDIGFLGSTPYFVSYASNNGSGAIRLALQPATLNGPASALTTNQNVVFNNINGVPGANGYFAITVISQQISATGSISGTTLTSASNSYVAGQLLSDFNGQVASGTIVLSGPTGSGPYTYTVSISQTVPSKTIYGSPVVDLQGSSFAGAFTASPKAYYGVGYDVQQHGRRYYDSVTNKTGYIPSATVLTAGLGFLDATTGAGATQLGGADIVVMPNSNLPGIASPYDGSAASGSIFAITYSNLGAAYFSIGGRSGANLVGEWVRFNQGVLAFQTPWAVQPVNGIGLEQAGAIAVVAASQAFTIIGSTIVTGTGPNAFYPGTNNGASLGVGGGSPQAWASLILGGSSSGIATLVAPATGGGIATLFAGSDTVVGVAAPQTLTGKTLSTATLSGTITGPDSAAWTSSGIGSLKALGVNETVPAAGSINISGQYKVAGAQIAASNLSNGTIGTGSIVLAASPTLTGTIAIGATGAPTPFNNAVSIFSGNTGSTGGLVVGQDSSHGILFQWNFNATAANAAGQLLTYGNTNPIYIDGSALLLEINSGGTIQTGSGTWTANGTTSLSLTNIGPAGAHATVQEWFTVKDASGTVRYIPAF